MGMSNADRLAAVTEMTCGECGISAYRREVYVTRSTKKGCGRPQSAERAA